jgi:alkanesulfonate monooxygenase SsuD/methylene tetrahydromethanopterin reductase-like flavin-dependent oxidoreductase (luciferase family)
MAKLRLAASFGGGFDPPEMPELASKAEELGYDSFWVSEGSGGDQFSLLTACALATKRVRLGTDISSVFVRSAPTIAMAAACVDTYSKGRFVLGLGSSHKVQVEGEHGLPYSKPLTRIKETMEIARALWRDGTASYKGEVFNINHFGFAFKPYRKEIPIYLGAVFDKMMALSGEMAQGVILTKNTPRRVQEIRKIIAESAKAAGRKASEVEIASLLTCYVTKDRKGAETEARQTIAYTCGFYPRYNRLIAESGFEEETAAVAEAWRSGDRERAAKLVTREMVESFAIIGEAGECRERIQEHIEARVDLPILTFRAWSKESKRRIGETMEGLAKG